MAIGYLITQGLAAVLGANDTRLAELVVALGAPEEAAPHVRQTLESMPTLMRAIDDALWSGAAPPEARVLWLTVVSYLVHDRNLVPAGERNPIAGLLDDAYLLHRVALELEGHLGPVDMRSVAGGAQLLSELLPRGVVRRLDDRLRKAKYDAQLLRSGQS